MEEEERKKRREGEERYRAGMDGWTRRMGWDAFVWKFYD